MWKVLKISRNKFFVAKRKKIQNDCSMLLLSSNSDLSVSYYLYTCHSTLSVQELFVSLMQSKFSYTEVGRSHSN